MGSTNLKCCVSNSPLTPGDEVVLFMLVSTNRLDSNSTNDHKMLSYSDRPWDYFKILGFGFDAYYDDYQQFNWDEYDPKFQYNLEVIKKHQTCHNISTDDINIEYIKNFIGTEFLTLGEATDKKDFRYMQLFAVKKCVHENMMNGLSNSVGEYGKDYSFESYVNYRNEHINELNSNFHNIFNDYVKKMSEDIGIIIKGDSDSIYTGSEVLETALIYTMGSRSTISKYDKLYYSYKQSANLLYESFLRTTEVENKIWQYELEFFVHTLKNMHIMLLPTTSTSQDDDLISPSLNMISIHSNIIKNELKRECTEINFKLVDPFIQIKLSDVVNTIQSHWDIEFVDQLSIALSVYVNSYGDENVKFTYKELNDNNLAPFLHGITSNSIDVQIINDL